MNVHIHFLQILSYLVSSTLLLFNCIFSHSFSWVPFYTSSSLWTPLNIEITLLLIFLNSQVFCKFLLFILPFFFVWPYLIASHSISRLTIPVVSQNLTFTLGTKVTYNNSFLIFLILKLVVMCNLLRPRQNYSSTSYQHPTVLPLLVLHLYSQYHHWHSFWYQTFQRFSWLLSFLQTKLVLLQGLYVYCSYF